MYFSNNYAEARKKFLEASQAVGASVESFKSPHVGPEGDSLYTDVTLLGPSDAGTILVLGSGTHGVEGFTGSAIQTGLLQEGIEACLKSGIRIILIHAINPYGFAYLRRFNEDNIDLNRNFIDHSQPYPENFGYEELINAISPKSISFLAEIKSFSKFFWYYIKNGKAKLKKAISGGQYIHPQGSFYGGKAVAWSNKTIRAITKRYLSNADKIIVVDFHTGLGPFGNAEVILNEKEQSPAYQRSVKWWGDKVKTTIGGESVSIHLEGSLKLALPKMLPDTEVTAVSLEFGTFSALKVFLALRAENWLYHHGGGNHPKTESIKTEFLRAFCPNTDEWKLKVWNQGIDIVKQVLRQLP